MTLSGDDNTVIQLAARSIGVAVLALHRPNARLIFLEGINMNHPIEDHRMERSSGGGASFLRRD
jgi:hypothetical protein